MISLTEHDSRWAAFYLEEEKRIRSAVGDLIVDIQHIGSTAIPGIKAKPIIDILVGVERLELGVRCKDPLNAIGYDYIERAGIANDLVFGKGKPRTHYLHVVEYGSGKWRDHLCFRDRLRSEPELAQKYERLKEELSRKFADSHAKYHDAKVDFIEEVVANVKLET